MLCSRNALRSGASSWFYISVDRCNQWYGSYSLPIFNQLGVAAKTEYLGYGDENPNKITLLFPSTKSNGDQVRIFCAKTTDENQTYQFRSWVREDPEGMDIMPSSIKLDSASIITAIRSRNSSQISNWIDLMRSEDEETTWEKNITLREDNGNQDIGCPQRRWPYSYCLLLQ